MQKDVTIIWQHVSNMFGRILEWLFFSFLAPVETFTSLEEIPCQYPRIRPRILQSVLPLAAYVYRDVD